jgi:elongator complex protein 4
MDRDGVTSLARICATRRHKDFKVDNCDSVAIQRTCVYTQDRTLDLMAFRKRNIGIGSQPASPASPATIEAPTPIEQLPGVRPSPLTSHPVTSTGAPSIDGLLGGHSGLALGSSLLVGEHDTTDFAGALLRYYAAEGLLQGHVVHIVGVGEGWVRELPGLADARYMRKQEQEKATDTDKAAQDRMKIAWRYERLGQTGGDRGALAASHSLEYQYMSISILVLPFEFSTELTGKYSAP